MKSIVMIIGIVLCSFNLYSLDHGIITGFELGYNIIDRTFIGNPDKGDYTNKDNDFTLSGILGYRIESFRINQTLSFSNLSLNNYSSVLNISYEYSIFKLEALYLCKFNNVDKKDIDNKSIISISISCLREF